MPVTGIVVAIRSASSSMELMDSIALAVSLRPSPMRKLLESPFMLLSGPLKSWLTIDRKSAFICSISRRTVMSVEIPQTA